MRFAADCAAPRMSVFGLLEATPHPPPNPANAVHPERTGEPFGPSVGSCVFFLLFIYFIC